MDKQFRGRGGGGDSEGKRAHGGERGQGRVGQAVGQRAQADHDEDLDAVVLERQRKGREALVLADEAVHVACQHGAAGHEGGQAADDGGGGDDEPALHAVDEARDGRAARVADDGREGREGCDEEDGDPAAGGGAPFLADGGQGREDAARVDHGEDADGEEEDVDDDEDDAVF